jgi:glycosyltransferase involved in cell wall biosynthesis
MTSDRVRRGYLFGTNIKVISPRFYLLSVLILLMSSVTLVASVFFRVAWLFGRAAAILSSAGRDGGGGFDLICISHVPWDGIWQRNQQTMSRFSRSERVVYARPLNALEASDNLRHLSSFFGKRVNDNLMVINPVTLWGDTRFGLIRRVNRFVVVSFIRFGMKRMGFRGRPRVLWFYFPRCEAICGAFGEELVVYDIQDEYTTWTNATRDIGDRERQLLRKAGLVFTGTNSLFRKKRPYNENIHFIQNGVEVEHFGLAMQEETEIPGDLKPLPRPVIGYFGLIGDRIDETIIRTIADRRPEWSVVLIGPVREEMCHIPDRKNIYLLGQRDYSSLPGYLKGFDVAIIPYMLNKTTMDLNPTKLLEYMAGGRPVVSTAMADVVELFHDYVYVAHDPEEFLRMTEEAVVNPDNDLVRRGVLFAGKFTWEAMVKRMRGMIIDEIESKQALL